ncbi:hypothetical protein TPHA_0D01520 [Tetrapisispora phaffii CBS 4417]|uniref:U3 small nucleolar RNA-associated protein 25 n=1 Tax=Tetrapisispora phaffii (strain ATCC 24235 / CBS 4417 / NBRC 1672 / NRRL Y-8282 / UCD 70-5) TaxID=1071381 RepID=G8BSH1_TETPH|nr:hypothetical protein TPHA_0D01520 [Tetrapisispora phaffii CBS 4417]CCE62792.1 hypothetical protein TPHA_0D01520 [Tetrapisispora phaffii CBS 4417]
MSGRGEFKKRGRSQLRTIQRSKYAKKRNSGRNYDTNTKHNDESKPADALVSGEEAESESDDAKDEEDVGKKRNQVYGALLTILKSEHPEKKKQKKKFNQEKEDAYNASDDEYNVSDKQEIENGLEDQQDDNEDENENDMENMENDDESDDDTDLFDIHFNQVPENVVDKISNGFDNKKIKYVSKKIQLPHHEKDFFIYSKPIVDDGNKHKVESPIKKSSLDSYFIKKRLEITNNLLDGKDNLTKLQKSLVDPMFQYVDILHEYENYGSDEQEYRELYTLHILNHLYKTRDKVLKDNQRLQENNESEFLDQGFTRPKVLIVVPTRDTAYNVVETIIRKSGLDQVEKKGKFKSQFFEDSLPPSSKPKSFQSIFKGNTNDFFVLGLKFTRKALKLYSNFYQSDVIICSPLGLHMITENTDKKKKQDDFLSSIEITILDQLHSMEYQNISHIMNIFEHLNKIPREQHDADFSRIRMWYINDQARLFRQTMIFTKYVSPTANAMINGKCRNIAGRWRNKIQLTSEESSLGKLGLKIRQIFQRFDLVGGTLADEPDFRFKFFVSVVMNSILKSTGYEDGILVYIPNYSDYMRVRNYMKEKTTLLFGDINEYSDQRELNSNRSLFQQGRVKVLLYTERLHHYRRYEIKGVKSVIFYGPPTNPEFYNEVVRFIGKNAFLGNVDINIATVRMVYSKLDSLSLERIVGTQRAAVLSRAENEVYEFK